MKKQIDPEDMPTQKVHVSPWGLMYASCNADCSERLGRVITIGVIEVRLCTTHLNELLAGLKR